MILRVAARDSPLSRVQVEEVLGLIRHFQADVIFDPLWIKTRGDLDRKTSLRTLGKCNFFTAEIDALVHSGAVRLGIHSAKDLPDPLQEGLFLAAITKGIDARDVLVLRKGETLKTLKTGAWIATSSKRREEMVQMLRSDVRFADLRGTIGERLEKLWKKEMDGVVIAEAALIRLKLTYLTRIFLPGSTAKGQGQLAVICRRDDAEMVALFSPIHEPIFG